MGTYNYSSNKKLSDHFYAQEFKCKCASPHEYVVNDNLVERLERLYKKLSNTIYGISAIIINSGYRCASHDIAVGGNGSGKHTVGMAADIVCYDKNKSPIPSKVVCCVAQDVGFPAIGKIDDTAVHVDVRTYGGWYGDESLPNGEGTVRSVTDDFYDYFDLGKPDIYGDVTTTPNVIVYKISDCKSICITGDEIRIEPKNGTVK